MLIYLIGNAKQVELLADVGDCLEFPPTENLSSRICGTTGDDCSQRKLLTCLQLATASTQLISIQLKILAVQCQNVCMSSELIQDAPVIWIVRLENEG